MTHVIGEPCIGVKDASCVDVCPVDCIHPTKDEAEFEGAEMLYIDPDTCVQRVLSLCDLRGQPPPHAVHPCRRGVLAPNMRRRCVAARRMYRAKTDAKDRATRYCSPAPARPSGMPCRGVVQIHLLAESTNARVPSHQACLAAAVNLPRRHQPQSIRRPSRSQSHPHWWQTDRRRNGSYGCRSPSKY